LDRTEYPGTDTDAQRDTGEDDGLAGASQCFEVSLLQRPTLEQKMFELGIDVNAVVDTDTNAERDDRQRFNLDPDTQLSHQRFAEYRRQSERNDDTEHRTNRSEADIAEYADHGIHEYQHHVLGIVDDFVRGCIDPGITGA